MLLRIALSDRLDPDAGEQGQRVKPQDLIHSDEAVKMKIKLVNEGKGPLQNIK